jgi:hypothetical protein
MRRILALIYFIILVFPLDAQTTPDGSMPQFLFPDFTLGKVRLKNGGFQSILLNYNTVSEKMVYKKDEKLYDVVNTEIIDTVFIKESKFVPAGQVFYEVLLVGPISLYIQHHGNLLPPPAVAGYGGTSEVSNTRNLSSVDLSMGYYNLKLPQDYTVKVDQVFWINKDQSMISYVTERQFLKIFPDKGANLKEFIKNQKIRFDKVPDQILLLKHCNELTK